MSPTNKQVVQKKLVRLERNLTYLEGYKGISADQLETDFTIQGAVLHYLVECIEIIMDIGNHILSDDFALSADTYFDVILKLGELSVIPADFAQEHAAMAKFRNRIIHIYEDVSLEEVYKILQTAPAIYKSFATYFAGYLNL